MKRWPRPPVLPFWTIPSFLLAYALFESPILIMVWSLSLKYPATRPVITELLWEQLKQGSVLGMVTICVAAIAYGLYRVVGFHPYFRPEYRVWLERTPWVWPHPLPLGPVHLIWEDAVVPVLLGLLAVRHVELTIVTPAIIFAGAYLAAIAIAFLGTRQWSFGYALLFLIGLMVRLKMFPYIAAVVALGSYLLSWVGLQRCLTAFPWVDEGVLLQLRNLFDTQKQNEREVGWPFKQLGPSGTELSIRPIDGLLMSLLVAWWLYALSAIVDNRMDRNDGLRFVCGAVVCGAIVIRLLIYIWGYVSPISFWGRLVTMRWIIPGFDKIFVAPLLIALVWKLATVTSERWDLLYVAPASVFAMLFIAFNVGPTLRNWRLTGTYRMYPLLLQGQNRKL